MSKVISPYGDEPKDITTEKYYTSKLSSAFNWYNQEKDKKDARMYLRHYILLKDKKLANRLDEVPDQQINTTFGWLSRLVVRNSTLALEHQTALDNYISSITTTLSTNSVLKTENRKVSVRENMEEKVKHYLGELENSLDEREDFRLYESLKTHHIPAPYLSYIQKFIQRKADEFISVYQTSDSEVKEAYSNFNKRDLTKIIKQLSSWSDDVERYSNFKKANRKPKPKKVKPAVEQVSQLKYLKECRELNLTSINPTDIVGSSQVWVYHVKYKRLAVYRTDSSLGIQVKGSSLQNYDPEQCEQKILRKPLDTLQKVLSTGKIGLRKILSELNTKSIPVTGRLSQESLIIRTVT